MRRWSLKKGDPLCLTLAADARLSPTDYVDDQIWDVVLSGGAPAALSVETTFGLRARSFRIFPRFGEDNVTRTDPLEFDHSPVVSIIHPNYLTLHCVPFLDIDVQYELWVPDSHSLSGRLQFTNQSKIRREIRLDLVAQLTPTEGQRMASLELQAASVLSGFSASVAPVVLLTGGGHPGTGSFPTLRQELVLEPGEQKSLEWVEAALLSPEASFAYARQLATRNWDAERARIELLNASHLEIYTGDPDWDAAFELAQKQAFSLLAGPGKELPHPSFVLSRQPDQGYSIRADGSDYNHQWNGQTVLDAWYLADYLLPSSPDWVAGLIRNFLSVQEENGFIDWKPGLSGQRSHILATPLLASLAWRVYEINQDRAFLQEVYPGLLAFLKLWFGAEHDRDQDGLPEWDYPSQMGIDTHPLYSLWEENTLGIDIQTAESPALIAFLYQECQAMLKMADLLGRNSDSPQYHEWAGRLVEGAGASWNDEEGNYLDIDRDAHYSTSLELLGERYGTGEITLNRHFEHPVRIYVQLELSRPGGPRPDLFIRGASASGNPRLEQISGDEFKMFLSKGVLTGERIYSAIDQVEVQNLDQQDRICFYTAAYRCACLNQNLILWAKLADPAKANSVVEKTLLLPERFWRSFGLPTSLSWNNLFEEDPSVNLPLNSLIGEGMLESGFVTQAAELVAHLMSAVILNLKQEGAFRHSYDSASGQGQGERNALSGLPPLGLFLRTLGIQLISPDKVALRGSNPYPWPVTLKYRGLTVLRQKEKTNVIFPDGNIVEIDDPSPQLISLEPQPVQPKVK